MGALMEQDDEEEDANEIVLSNGQCLNLEKGKMVSVPTGDAENLIRDGYAVLAVHPIESYYSSMRGNEYAGCSRKMVSNQRRGVSNYQANASFYNGNASGLNASGAGQMGWDLDTSAGFGMGMSGNRGGMGGMGDMSGLGYGSLGLGSASSSASSTLSVAGDRPPGAGMGDDTESPLLNSVRGNRRSGGGAGAGPSAPPAVKLEHDLEMANAQDDAQDAGNAAGAGPDADADQKPGEDDEFAADEFEGLLD